jgi:hypothetical protein
VGELAVLAGAVLAVVADLSGATETTTWSLLTAFMGESAVLAGAVLAIVADLLGSAETTAWSLITISAETTTWSLVTISAITTAWSFSMAFWLWTVGETAVLSLAVLAFVAVLLATQWATSTLTT